MQPVDTLELYRRFPYPSPDPDADLIPDIANGIGLLLKDESLREWQVLDAGCGTGHRLVALALQYPQARFTAVDPSAHSLKVARGLAQRHGASNIEFVEGALPDLELPHAYDLIVCSGVLHHLPDQRAGLRWLTERLAPDGLLFLWLYNALGEHDRMLERELVRILAGGAVDESGLDIVRALGLALSRTRYGATAQGGGDTDTVQAAVDADAYLNPIVRPVRFSDVPDLFESLPVDWVAAYGINTEGGGQLLDLGQVEEEGFPVVRPDDFFDQPRLKARLRELPPIEQARVLELVRRPTGFSLVAGRGTGLEECVPRLRGSLLLGEAAGRVPVLGQSAGDRRRRRMVRVALGDELIGVGEKMVERWGAAAMERVTAGIDMAVGRRPRILTDPEQRPALFHLPGLPATPWVDTHRLPGLAGLAARLESAWREIRGELDALRAEPAGGLDNYVDGAYMSAKFADRGRADWRSLTLYTQSEVQAVIADRCPATAAALGDIGPGLSGDVMFSQLLPGTELAAHHDDNTYKLTVHLPLRVPSDSGIRVDGQTRRWEEGRCLAFSDAYRHEAWNHGAHPREILLLDVWHPEVTEAERDALEAVRAVLAPACRPGVFDRF
ncbi:aspartyl/asparaginyl beta-hydroxylase domain-containing protein [Streptomyces eurythermus]|uniref:aspartyl/asparaginyl beta-hydroxylase domain-containing protein n=1 Tax=Streptomyces eurythermus TaxID=42237 RepID=UPI003686F6E0